METLISAFFNTAILRETAPYLWSGFLMSVLLTIVVVPLGVAGGLALALLSTVRIRALRLTIPPLTNRTIAITKGTALGATVAVGEILYQAQTGYSFSYNPSPLTLGAIAYLILFIPVVWFGRWVETRFAWKR